MAQRAIQDFYPDRVSHCYGCGRLNEHGLHIKSYRQGDAAVCTFLPQPYDVSFAGTVYLPFWHGMRPAPRARPS